MDFTYVSDWYTFRGCTPNHGCGYVSKGISRDTGWSGQAMKVNYNTTGLGGYWFVYKVLNQNWSDVDRIGFYYNETSESDDIYVGLVDADGETWCAELDKDNTDWEKVTINITDFPWRDPWGVIGNGVLDLHNIKEIRFRHWPQRVGTGTFWVDEIKIER